MKFNHVLALILAILLGYSISFIFGQKVGMEIYELKGTCHSITEDSPPNDCKFTRIDSTRGVWHK